MQHKINDTIFNFQGYLVDICYDDYTRLQRFYKTTTQNQQDLKAIVKTTTNTLLNCEPFYYIDATEIYEIIDDNYFKFAQNHIQDDNKLELLNYCIQGENFKFTIPTKQENIPSNVALVKKITELFPSLLTQNNDTDEKIVSSMIDILKQLYKKPQTITLKQTYTQYGEIDKNSFNIDEAIEFVEDKKRLPIFITQKDIPCGVILGIDEYHHMEHCSNIVEDTQIYESIKDRLKKHKKEN